MIFDNPRSAAARYGAAILAIAVAALVRYWADSVLGGSGFSLFLAAVAVASWYGGLGPSLVALTLSVLISVWLFRGEPQPAVRVWTGLAVFYFVGVVIALSSRSMRAAQRRAEVFADEAIRQREQLQSTMTALGKSEQRFARFMQHLPGLAWIKDCEGRYVYANDAAEKAFRTPRADLTARPTAKSFRPKRPTSFRRMTGVLCWLRPAAKRSKRSSTPTASCITRS
jgi:PAS domain-containing protein